MARLQRFADDGMNKTTLCKVQIPDVLCQPPRKRTKDACKYVYGLWTSPKSPFVVAIGICTSVYIGFNDLVERGRPLQTPVATVTSRQERASGPQTQQYT